MWGRLRSPTTLSPDDIQPNTAAPQPSTAQHSTGVHNTAQHNTAAAQQVQSNVAPQQHPNLNEAVVSDSKLPESGAIMSKEQNIKCLDAIKDIIIRDNKENNNITNQNLRSENLQNDAMVDCIFDKTDENNLLNCNYNLQSNEMLAITTENDAGMLLSMPLDCLSDDAVRHKLAANDRLVESANSDNNGKPDHSEVGREGVCHNSQQIREVSSRMENTGDAREKSNAIDMVPKDTEASLYFGDPPDGNADDFIDTSIDFEEELNPCSSLPFESLNSSFQYSVLIDSCSEDNDDEDCCSNSNNVSVCENVDCKQGLSFGAVYEMDSVDLLSTEAENQLECCDQWSLGSCSLSGFECKTLEKRRRSLGSKEDEKKIPIIANKFESNTIQENAQDLTGDISLIPHITSELYHQTGISEAPELIPTSDKFDEKCSNNINNNTESRSIIEKEQGSADTTTSDNEVMHAPGNSGGNGGDICRGRNTKAGGDSLHGDADCCLALAPTATNCATNIPVSLFPENCSLNFADKQANSIEAEKPIAEDDSAKYASNVSTSAQEIVSCDNTTTISTSSGDTRDNRVSDVSPSRDLDLSLSITSTVPLSSPTPHTSSRSAITPNLPTGRPPHTPTHVPVMETPFRRSCTLQPCTVILPPCIDEEPDVLDDGESLVGLACDGGYKCVATHAAACVVHCSE